MARGFLGALDSFAGGFAQGMDRAQKMDLARAAEARAQAEEDRRKQEFDRVVRDRQTLEAAANEIDAPDNRDGFLSVADYEKKFGANPTATDGVKPEAAPAGTAPKTAALPAAPAVTAAPSAPAAPAAPVMGGTSGNRVPKAGDIQTIDPNTAVNAPAAALPAETPAVPAPAPTSALPSKEAAPAQAVTPEGTKPTPRELQRGDYRLVEINGEFFYAPATRVTVREGQQSFERMARALERIGQPAQAMAYRQSAAGLEKANLELNTARVAEGVTRAKALLVAGDFGGFANTVTNVYNNNVPDGMRAQIIQTEEGPTLVQRDVSGMETRRVVLGKVDPTTGMSGAQMLVGQLESLTSPQGMTNWITATATMRGQVISQAYNRAQTEYTTALTREVPANAAATRNSQYAAADAATRGADYNYGGSFSDTPFSAVRGMIFGAESNGGDYNIAAYGTKTPKPLTSMSLGELYSWQRNEMRPMTRGRRGPDDIGSTGVGAYQFESETLRATAQKVFGNDWQSVQFTPANQDKLAEALYNEVRGNPTLLGNTWHVFRGASPGGLPLSPRDSAAASTAAAKAAREQQEKISAATLKHMTDNGLDINDPVAVARATTAIGGMYGVTPTFIGGQRGGNTSSGAGTTTTPQGSAPAFNGSGPTTNTAQGNPAPGKPAGPQVYNDTWTGALGRVWDSYTSNQAATRQQLAQQDFTRQFAQPAQRLQAEIKSGRVNQSTINSVRAAYANPRLRQFLPQDVQNFLSQQM